MVWEKEMGNREEREGARRNSILFPRFRDEIGIFAYLGELRG